MCLAIVRVDALDALMSLTDGMETSRLDPLRRVVYVEYVGVAPEHQPAPIGSQHIRGLGTLLVKVASEISRQLGRDGHVGLHAKPDVEDFYRNIRLHECARERMDDGVWRYFEACPFWRIAEKQRRRDL